MKKMVAIVICVAMLLTLTSCNYGEKRKQETADMFESFEKNDNVILLTCFELVVGEEHYDLDEIKYNDQECHIVYLEEDGFYSYTYNQNNLSVEFLYTQYDGFKTISLGTETLPSEIRNDLFCDNCFCFGMRNPNTDESKPMYYFWHVDTKEVKILDKDSVTLQSLNSIDNNRSDRYSFSYTSTFLQDYINITDNETGLSKRIDKSILNTFDEGKQIKKAIKSTKFNIDRVFVDEETIYFATIAGVNFLGDPCYYYIYKWNFETEKCEFYTYVYFERWQEWLTDMYIK